MKLLPVPTLLAPQLRVMWEPFSVMIAAEGLQTPAAIADDILSGRVLICLAWDEHQNEPRAMAGVELLKDAQGRTICHLVWCVGDGMPEWFDLLDEIETWAKDHLGCLRMRATHRTGWARLLKGKGYRETHRVSEKDLA